MGLVGESSAMASSTSVASTDSYPINFRSFSTDLKSDEIGTNRSELPPDIGVQPDALETGEACASRIAALGKVKWDKEQFDTRRPYERKSYDRSYRRLPGHLAEFEGLDVKPRKCAVTDTFARRTPIEEVFHKRNIKSVCATEAPRSLVDCVDDVIVADNVSSSETETEEECVELEQAPDKRAVSRECCKTFFRARRTLLRSEMFQEYFNREPPPPKEVDSDDTEQTLDVVASRDSLSQTEQVQSDSVQPRQVRSSSIGSYEPPAILHKESKAPVIKAQELFIQRMRGRYLQRFDRVRQKLEDAERERQKPPVPFDAEQYEADYPAPDITNQAKVHYRESLRKRLEELELLQRRSVRKYPASAKQFAAYKFQLMEDRRKLRDEALLVEDYLRNANTPKELPQARLEVRHYRLAEFGVQWDDAEDTEDERDLKEQQQQDEPLVYHTCLTREEWGHWLARSTKIEKLKLPKVNVPRLPVLVHKSHESPIRAYIHGRQDSYSAVGEPEQSHQRLGQPQEIASSIRTPASQPKVTMRDLLFDPMVKPEPVDYISYNINLRPYLEIAEQRQQRLKGQRKGQRQLRKSRMQWIEQLVDEICHRKRC
ncbi:uncharacterized protein LOC128730189 [Anopheles nili]|uniref:uncharacterized protein LOC128730189 n=1 Tax=Anopheles nili TaxID=185578 RepID=UPI00237BE9FC|nr:uncharacterized protein LOC128730189 [Anopheles nili]